MIFEFFILSIENIGIFCLLLINIEVVCFMVKSGFCEVCS